VNLNVKTQSYTSMSPAIKNFQEQEEYMSLRQASKPKESSTLVKVPEDIYSGPLSLSSSPTLPTLPPLSPSFPSCLSPVGRGRGQSSPARLQRTMDPIVHNQILLSSFPVTLNTEPADDDTINVLPSHFPFSPRRKVPQSKPGLQSNEENEAQHEVTDRNNPLEIAELGEIGNGIDVEYGGEGQDDIDADDSEDQDDDDDQHDDDDEMDRETPKQPSKEAQSQTHNEQKGIRMDEEEDIPRLNPIAHSLEIVDHDSDPESPGDLPSFPSQSPLSITTSSSPFPSPGKFHIRPYRSDSKTETPNSHTTSSNPSSKSKKHKSKKKKKKKKI